MTRKSSSISILQFDERRISRLRVHRSAKGIDVLGFDQQSGEWSTENESLQKALKEFAEKHRMSEDTVYSVVARHEMTARILSLPSQDPLELDNMVRLSAEEFVPFPVEELVISQCVLQKLSDGSSNVLAVFAHHDVIDNHVKCLQSAGIDPEQVFLSTACLASAAAASYKAGNAPYALVNLASGGLEVLVLRGKRVEYARAVASGQDWTSAADPGSDASEELGVEVRASLSAYRRESEDGEGVESVFLCSDYAGVDAHSGALTHEIGQECTPAIFARSLVTRGSESLTSMNLVALGAALSAQDRAEFVIRLLPETILKKRELSTVKRKAVFLAVLAGLILVALGGLYYVVLGQRQAYISELNRRIAEIEPRATSIVAKQKQLQILENQVDRSGSVVELLADLSDVFPAEGMNIGKFVFTHGQGIDLYGRSKKREDVEKLAQDLIDVGKTAVRQFARATQVYENEAQEMAEKIWDYMLTIPFPEEETKEGASNE